MSDYRGVWQDIDRMQKEDAKDPKRPLLRSRHVVLAELRQIEKELRQLGWNGEDE